MKRHVLIAAAAALLFAPSAIAAEDGSAAATAEADQETVQVEPGEGPTETMTEQVPDMTGSGTEEHPPTAEIGDEVPPMKPDDEKQAAGDDAGDDAQE